MAPDKRIVFVDVESIGLDPAGPVRQIAALAVDAELCELETFEARIKVDWQAVRRWRTDQRRRTPRPLVEAETIAAKRFADFLHRHATVDVTANQTRVRRVAQLAAHHASHDGPFLQAFFERNRRFFPGSYRVLCTVQRALWLFQEDKTLTPPRDFKLLTLCHYFAVPLRASDAHDALNDVRATAALYRAMHKRSQASAQTSQAADCNVSLASELPRPMRVAAIQDLSQSRVCAVLKSDSLGER